MEQESRCLDITESEAGRRLPRYRIFRIAEGDPPRTCRERDRFLLYYAHRGYARIAGDALDLRLGYGSIVILPPDKPHTVTLSSRGALITACAFTIGFVEDILRYHAGESGRLSAIFNANELLLCPAPADMQLHLAHLMEFIQHEYETPRSESEHVIKNCLATILCVLSELHGERLAAPEVQDKTSVVYAIEYIKSNYEKPLTLDEVAHLTCMSRKEFCGRFKRFTGRSFHDFLTKVRVEAAMKIIKESGAEVSLTALSSLCGYESYTSFYRNFIKHVGIPPAEYRDGRAE